MKRKSIHKKLLSLLLCACMVLTTIFVEGAFTKQSLSQVEAAEVVGERVENVRKEVVFDSHGYDNATPVANLSDPRTGTWYQLAGDLSPIEEPGNVGNNVLWYRHNWYGWGEIVLGHDYKNNTLTSPIRVEAGKTYAITYDYKILGSTGGTNLELGVGVFEELCFSGDTQNHTNGNYTTVAKQHQIEQVLKANTAPTTTEWVTHTAYVTIPENSSYSGSYLTLFMRMGNQSNDGTELNGVLFDNIKVESLAKYDETILSYNDYTTASKVSATSGRHGDYHMSSRDISPTYDIDSNNSSNIVLGYKHHYHGLGVIPLGYDYKTTGALTDNYIVAEQGTMYRIDYDYYVKGTPVSDLTIGVAVGNPDLATKLESATDVAGGGTYYSYVSDYKVIDTYVKNEQQDTGWLHKSLYYVVSEDCDVSVNNALQLYAKDGGNWGTDTVNVYFDNITVSKVHGISECSAMVDTIVADNDYAAAKTVTTTGSRSGDYHMSSRDLSPTKSITDSNNVVLGYRHNWYGVGVVPLGYDYANTGILTDNYIVAVPETSYKIEYDYYVKGTPVNNLSIGVAVGNPSLDVAVGTVTHATGNTYYANYTSDYQLENTFEKNVQYDTGWQRKTVYYTVPGDCDVSVNKTLQLYVKDGGNSGSDTVNVYFDNVKVTKLAGANVDYVVDGAVRADLSGYTSDGFVHNHALANAEDGATIKWYADKEFTQAIDFVESIYDVGTSFDEMTVYGKWSPVVRYYVNKHITGSTLPYDGIIKAYDSESAQLDTFTNVVTGTEAENLVSEYQFDGWYSVKQVGSDYYYDKKINTVAEAMEVGGAYARYIRQNSTTTVYDIVGPADGTTTNTYYDAFKGAEYATEYLDGQWTLKSSFETYPKGQKSVVIVNPSSAGYGTTTAINEGTYANLELDTAYKVTLKYKVLTKPENPMEITLSAASVAPYWSDNNKHELVRIATVDNVTNGWQEATAYFTVDALRGVYVNDQGVITDATKSTGRFADALAITTYGVGEIYYDEITVTALSDGDYKSAVTPEQLNFAVGETTNAGVTTFDNVATFTYDKGNESIQMKSDNYQPKVTGFKVNGVKVYESANAEGTAFKATYRNGEATPVTVSLYNKLNCENTSNFSVVATSSSDSDSMRFLLRTYSDYQDFGYFGNEAYAVVDRGVLVALTDYAGYNITAETLIPDTEGVQKISCMNGLFAQTENFYDYTVSIDGITELFANMNVMVRGYMTLSNGNTEFTVFTDNAITNSLSTVNAGGEGVDTQYDAQVDSDLILSETGITSVTLSLYDDNDADIHEYGVTWITDKKYDNNVIEVIEAGESFEHPKQKITEIGVTEYVSHFLKDETQYKNFNMSQHGSWNTEIWNQYNVKQNRYSNKGVISGLEAGKVYKYRVGYQNAEGLWNYSYIGTITTPKTSESNEFTFAFLADSQQDFKSSTSTLTKTLKAMMTKNPDIEFITHGGDIINYNSYEQQWTGLVDANKQYFMSIPFMPANGNHEYNMTPTQPYDFYHHFNMYSESPEIVNPETDTPDKEVNGYSGTYYSYDYRNVHFVVLNTNEGYVTGKNNSFKLTEAQIEWLKEDLASAKESADYTIVYMHCGLYMTGAFGSETAMTSSADGLKQNTQSMKLREQLNQIFYDGGVDLVMNGHDHIYSVTNVLDANGLPVQAGEKGVVHMTGAVAGVNNPETPCIEPDDQYPQDAANGVYASVIGKNTHCWTELNVTSEGIVVTSYTADTGTTGAPYSILHSFTIQKDNVGSNIPADGSVIK